VLLALAYLTQRTPGPGGYIDATRQSQLGGNLGEMGHGDGGNAAVFDDSSNQSDRPMTRRSSRGEQYQVYLVSEQHFGDFRSGVRDQFRGVSDAAAEAELAR